MRGSLPFLGLLACLPLVLSGASPPVQLVTKPVAARSFAMAATGVTGPAFDSDFPDPSVLRVGAHYYAFGTHTAWEPPGHVFPILVSTDLAHWTYAADVFSHGPTWGRGDWWAPAVVARGGAYYLYYSGMSKSGMHCLAVATATSPLGPYADHGSIACKDSTSAGYIDAWPLISGGRAYLYFSVDGPDHHSISVLPVNADMLSVAWPRVELFGVTQSWEALGHGTVEGPSVFAWGSRFVVLYSGGDWRERYGMGYAIGSSPLGPFTKSTTPLLQTGGALQGPGGGSFFTDASGRPWLAYHGWQGAGRVLYVTRLSISPAV